MQVTAWKLLSPIIPQDFIIYESHDHCLPITGRLSNASTTQAFGVIVEAAFARVAPPFPVHVRISSSVPGGSGLGTSAAMSVALLATLHALHGDFPDALSLAYEAHALETGCGLQSGIQDQMAAVFGGVNFFDFRYPLLTERRTLFDAGLLDHLNARLVTVFLGLPRSSSDVHLRVINSLTGRDNAQLFEPLLAAARSGYQALAETDFASYGRALVENCAAQETLHPHLVSETARRVIAVAKACGARQAA